MAAVMIFYSRDPNGVQTPSEALLGEDLQRF